MHILAEDVLDSLEPHEGRRHDHHLSTLNRARETLQRCLSLSKEFGEETRLGGLLKSDAIESIAKMLKDLEVQLEQLTESPPLPQSDLIPPYAPDSGSGVQSTTNNDHPRPLRV